MQSKFTALQGAIHDLKNLKQEFQQKSLDSISIYLIKMTIK